MRLCDSVRQVNGTTVGTYWWQGEKPNFGDALSPLLVKHFAGVEVYWADPMLCQLVSTGSVLDVLPQTGYRGVVAGSGKLFDSTSIDLTQAHVLGFRGFLSMYDSVLTVKQLRDVLAVGDPALLASELAPIINHGHDIGVVPHWSDTELYTRECEKFKSWGAEQPLFIDVTADPLTVIGQIGGCKKIVASSMHGIIVADAFGIPRRAERYPAMDTSKYENTYKWWDYSSSIRQYVEFGTLQEAPRVHVERAQFDLFEMFKELSAALG